MPRYPLGRPPRPVTSPIMTPMLQYAFCKPLTPPSLDGGWMTPFTWPTTGFLLQNDILDRPEIHKGTIEKLSQQKIITSIIFLIVLLIYWLFLMILLNSCFQIDFSRMVIQWNKLHIFKISFFLHYIQNIWLHRNSYIIQLNPGKSWGIFL